MIPENKNGASDAPFLTRPRIRRWLWMLLILWLALFLRVWQLDTLPPGLHYDEAFNGTMARDVLRGINRPIFFTPNFGEEPLHIYTEALLFAFLGESPWTIRLVSAFFGVIFVAAIYACARAFFPPSDLISLTAAFIAATLYWAINFSRIGIETNGLPMLLTLSAAALAHAYRKMSWGWVIGAGFLIGATVYTYLASRLWLAAVLLWFIYLVLFHRATIRAHFSKWIVIGIVALFTLAPLIYFFIQNPVAFSGRSGTVFTPEIFFTGVARTAGMFFLSGDLDPRDNLPARPALDFLLFTFFLIGLLLSLARFRKPFYAFLLLWFVVMLLPSALTEFAPNFRRAIGAMPATILLCALGVDWLWQRIPSLHTPRSTLYLLGKILLVATLVTSAFWSARAYFVDWGSGTGLSYSFDAGLLHVARALAARPANEQLYLTPDYDEHYTVIWALDGRALSSFDGRRALVLPDSSRAASYGIILREDGVTRDKLQRAFNGSELPMLFIDTEGKSSYATLLTFPVGTRIESAAPNTPLVRVDAFAELRAARLEPATLTRDKTLQVELEWRALQPAPHLYTVSVQLVGPLRPTTGSTVWAQEDKQPAAGTYPTTAWQSGQEIFETFRIQIPRDALPGEYKIQVSMYLLETGARVVLYNRDNARVENDAFTIQTFALP